QRPKGSGSQASGLKSFRRGTMARRRQGSGPNRVKGRRNRVSAKRGLKMKRIVSILALTVAAAFVTQAASAQTLKQVKDRGTLNCGANGSLAGFGLPDAQGNWKGLDVDLCRAIAAAVLGDGNKIKFTALTAKDRFTALQSGEVDVLVRNTTWTSSREAALGLEFTGVDYFDGQGFMVRKSLKVNSALELNGASVCVQQGT